MNWYVLDKDYVKYLESFDAKVGYVDYGSKLKLHLGIILTVNKFQYYVPISSAKIKHQKMKNSIDFHKIKDVNTNETYAVLNLNNMIPVPDSYVNLLTYKNIEEFKSFSDLTEKNNYIYLLQKEKKYIDANSELLKTKAEKLYLEVLQNPNSRLAKRCCNFQLLEKKSLEYKH